MGPAAHDGGDKQCTAQAPRRALPAWAARILRAGRPRVASCEHTPLSQAQAVSRTLAPLTPARPTPAPWALPHREAQTVQHCLHSGVLRLCSIVLGAAKHLAKLRAGRGAKQRGAVSRQSGPQCDPLGRWRGPRLHSAAEGWKEGQSRPSEPLMQARHDRRTAEVHAKW